MQEIYKHQSDIAELFNAWNETDLPVDIDWKSVSNRQNGKILGSFTIYDGKLSNDNGWWQVSTPTATGAFEIENVIECEVYKDKLIILAVAYE